MFVHVCARCGRSELLTWAFLQFTPVPLVWRPAFCEFFLGGGRGWRRQQEWSHDRQMERELACASRAFCESEMTRQRRHLEGIMGIMGGSVLVFILATISMRRLYNYQNDPSDPSVIFFNAQIVPFVTVRHPIWSNPMAFTPRVRSPLGLSRS